MNTKRPCECGCSYNDHVKVSRGNPLEVARVTLYCKTCDKHDTWCYSYRPIKNLAWLEWLSK